jgi:two-component system, OmpR family, response regulator ChvI
MGMTQISETLTVAQAPQAVPSDKWGKQAPVDSPIRIALVDDDIDFRDAASFALTDLGFDVVPFADGASLFSFFDEGHAADIVVLDWRLPQGAGIDLLPKLRRRGIQLPVVFLTGIATAQHESVALERGALDFVDKDRGIDILARRIRLILEAGRRLPDQPAEQQITCGPLTLRPKVSRGFWNDVDVQLTVTEFRIVQLLVSSVGEFVSYRAIYDCVHSAGFFAGCGEDGFRTNVRSSMKRIRNKFKVCDADFSEIENFSAFGYRWRGSRKGAQ